MGRKSIYFWLVLIQVLIVWLIGLGAQTLPNASAQGKEISITIDDLPLNGPHIDQRKMRSMTGGILSVIKNERIPVVGFVNESLLYVPGETDAQIAILKAWHDAGVELGNHTFSHVRFSDVSLAEYEDDFVRGEAVTKMLLKPQKPRYFRHPYLRMAPTAELERSFESFIAERGYKMAPVTLDTMDWMFLAAHTEAQKQNDREKKKEVSKEYLKFAEARFDFGEKAAAELFGRPIRHVLLLHANELVADNFDALAKMLKKHGYEFISLEQALADPVYRFPDKYTDTSDWLSHWAFSQSKEFKPPEPPQFIRDKYAAAQQGR